MFFEDFQDKNRTIFENDINIKKVDSYATSANQPSSTNGKMRGKNRVLELKRGNDHQYSIATTNPIDIQYRNMQLEFYFQVEKFKRGDTFVVEYATQIDSPVWEVLYAYGDDDDDDDDKNDEDEDEWSYQMVEWQENNPGDIVLQFRCETSGLRSRLYIDDVTLMARNSEETSKRKKKKIFPF